MFIVQLMEHILRLIFQHNFRLLFATTREHSHKMFFGEWGWRVGMRMERLRAKVKIL